MSHSQERMSINVEDTGSIPSVDAMPLAPRPQQSEQPFLDGTVENVSEGHGQMQTERQDQQQHRTEDHLDQNKNNGQNKSVGFIDDTTVSIPSVDAMPLATRSQQTEQHFLEGTVENVSEGHGQLQTERQEQQHRTEDHLDQNKTNGQNKRDGFEDDITVSIPSVDAMPLAPRSQQTEQHFLEGTVENVSEGHSQLQKEHQEQQQHRTEYLLDQNKNNGQNKNTGFKNDKTVNIPSVDAMPLASRSQQNEQPFLEGTVENVSEISDQMQTEHQDQQQDHTEDHLDQSQNNGQNKNVGLEENLNIPRPPSDWKFNNFLVDLADSITDKELETMKSLFRGEEIGERTLSSIETPSELFKILRQREFLNTENLLYLQAMLLKLKRPELIQMAIDYARNVGNLLYFSPASHEPLNGYRYVQFHVEGKDFKNCPRGYIQNVRNLVADILFIEPRNVTIVGVEPSSSMLITLAIPEIYVELLERMLKTDSHLEKLTDIGIDTVAVNGKAYKIHGLEQEEKKSDQQEKLQNVYQQLQNKKKQLDTREKECLQFSREIKTLKRKLEETLTLDVRKRSLYNAPMQDGCAANNALPDSSILTDFVKASDLVTELGYDRNVIQRLLDAYTLQLVSRIDEHEKKQQQMTLRIKELQAQIVLLNEIIEKIKVDVRVQSKVIVERFLYEVQEKTNAAMESPEAAVFNIKMTEHDVRMLESISNELHEKEKNELEKKYEWDPNDSLTLVKNADKSTFFLCIYRKEVLKTGKAVHVGKFIDNCLLDIERKDLLLKSKELGKHRQLKEIFPRKDSI